MALDGMFLSFMCKAVNDTLAGSKVDKIHQPGKNELVFIMRTRGGMHKLYFSADANSPRFCIVENTPENPQTPPMLCMLFRKRLVGATLISVEQYGLDRIAFFNFDATNEIGDKVKLTLAIEIMAQHSNVILFDKDTGRIIDALRRVDAQTSSFRLVLPGAQYKLPPAQDKIDLRESDTTVACEKILSLENAKLSSAIIKSLQGISPLLSRELSYRACGDDKGVGELDSNDKLNLFTELSSLKTMLISGEIQPSIVLNEEQKPMEFSFLPITQYGKALRVIHKESVFSLLEGFYSERDRFLRTRSKASELFKSLDNLIERTSRKLNNQREDLKKCADRDEIKIKAELITASQYMLQKGASVYDVFNYYTNENQKIEVDPALTPSQNAQRLYKEYHKACTAEDMLIKLIDEGEQDLEYLKSVRDMLSRATLEREFGEIKDELISQGFIKPKKTSKKQMKKQALQPLEFKTTQGLTVLVGRNNIQNDKLTFKTGRKGDIWLHAQKCPGSHVLLLADGGEVPDDAIVEAAEIAAYYSSAREGTVVTVDYTDVKNIKKPNGAKPGFVVYYTYYSVNVKPKEKA